MPITRRDLLAGAAALSVAVAMPSAAFASSAAPVTGEQALAALGADGLVRVLGEGFHFFNGWTRDGATWHERFLRHVGPAIRIAYAQGQVTFHGLANSMDTRRLLRVIEDQALPTELREKAFAVFSDTPGFDPLLGLRQPMEVLDIHGYVAMHACLLLGRLEFDVVTDDLARGSVDWGAMDV